MWEYHTITLYSGLALTLFRMSIILLHLLAYLMIFWAYYLNRLSLWIMTPSDLYYRAIPYPLYSLLWARSHALYFIWPSMNNILDFFLLIDISFLSTQLSHTSRAVSRLPILLLAILVSSANSYGCRLTTCKISPVKSFVKILNNRQDIPHPCPSPLPMCMFPSSD